MKITKEKIVSIIIRFFKEQKKISVYLLAKKVEVDQKSLKAWEMEKHESIHFSSVERLASKLQSDISSSFEEFSEFAIAELEKCGISREYTWEIFDIDRGISTIIEQLLKLDISEQKNFRKK